MGVRARVGLEARQSAAGSRYANRTAAIRRMRHRHHPGRDRGCSASARTTGAHVAAPGIPRRSEQPGLCRRRQAQLGSVFVFPKMTNPARFMRTTISLSCSEMALRNKLQPPEVSDPAIVGAEIFEKERHAREWRPRQACSNRRPEPGRAFCGLPR